MYGYDSFEGWANALCSNVQTGGANAKKEMESLKAYLDKNKMPAGIILFQLVADVRTQHLQTFYRHKTV